MAEYPIRIPQTDSDQELAASIESFINSRFESVSAERMMFNYDVIATATAVSIETVRRLLEPLEGGTDGLMVWKNVRRRPRPQQR